MAEVKILFPGYFSADGNEGIATITLIKDKNLNILVDPGVLESQDELINKLKDEGLSVNDIDIVCITHSHLDHYRNIGLFPTAKTLEYWGLWDKKIVEDWPEQFTEDIKIIKTPGHNYDCISLLVNTDKGIVAIVGDVFWKEDYPDDDPYASDKDKLNESRQKILKLADWIIPGHGDIYKVKK